MTNCLLIHNDNLPSDVIEAFGDKIKFDIPQSKMLEYSYSFDKEAHRQLDKALEEQNYDAIFLPYYLSEQNYLELTGLRLAVHIRLTPKFNHQHVPIVFLGSETPEQIAKLSNLGNVLFTSGVYSTSRQDQNSLKKQFEWIIKNKPKISDTELIRCIERLKIAPPANYQSHHSIDNELALARWSEFLKCDDNITEVRNNLQTGLYFKYHRALNPVNPVETGSLDLISGRGKVLLIDDEAEKGWKDFYECFFQKNIRNESIEFESLQADFKSCQQEIIEVARDKVEKFNADVVLLDLRLCDSDFATNLEPKELTGYKILEEIKKINKGFQVIITTASNKVWNYQTTNELGNGYIIKKGDSDVAKDIENMKNKIEHAIKASQPLKDFYKISANISQNINNEQEWVDDFKNKAQDYLDISFDLLVNSFKNSDYRRYVYLQLFLIIEEFLAQEHIFSYGDNCFVDNNILVAHKIGEDDNRSFKSIIERNPQSKIYTINESEYNWTIDVNYKMSAVLIFRYGFDSSNEKDWHIINKIRNTKAAHKGNTVSLDDVQKLINFIDFIVTPENKQLRSQDEGLSQPSFDDQMEKLKAKFNRS